MTDWKSLDQTYIMSTYNRLPIAIERGVGNHLYDVDGKAYLDLFTGLAVNILGHSHPAIVKTIKDQGEKFLHISNVFLNPPAITLAKTLVENSIPGKVFFVNSGAEATEAALKLIHKWKQTLESDRDGIVVLKKSFHGRTLGALKLTRQPNVYQDFPVTSTPVYEVDPGDLEQVEELFKTKKPLAILMEPVLGSGGIVPLEADYLQGIEKLCKEHQVLFGIDEIQTGIGRTGKLFAYQHSNITPDLILFAKGVGGGLPLGGLISGEKLANLFQPGDHGTTFAPSPLSAALGNTVLDVLLHEGQLQAGKEHADYLWGRLLHLKESYPALIEDIRGIGMMIGIATKETAANVKQFQKQMLDEGYLIDVTQQTIVRLLPPLTLTRAEIDDFIVAFEKNLNAIKKEVAK
ncbi:aspartate aminotransferase family protein [Desertibacillus haloalkaliphilus]|uniref:aspartate aminotransferase family protein n=1 Tax=Desertibacillus haloalkaliphilus TaxID=1328930 RepID=UPI001C2698F3|nr:acetylornithine transaminase [Desertibacillus haloalkaliphilus]MBU8906769.1 acetylornithine transaminase [Desertibacillus haloalkaliphilus]